MDPVERQTAERRKKVKHYDGRGGAHFLTFSCYRRLPLLCKDRTRHWFLDALDKARAKHGLDLWALVQRQGLGRSGESPSRG